MTCVCLGLGIGGDEVQFDRNVCGLVASVMRTNVITIESVFEMMKCMIGTNVDDVENVCRLYILVCFAVLYFPRNSRTICNIPCSVLDNLDTLSNYNWAKVVHSYLVNN